MTGRHPGRRHGLAHADRQPGVRELCGDGLVVLGAQHRAQVTLHDRGQDAAPFQLLQDSTQDSTDMACWPQCHLTPSSCD